MPARILDRLFFSRNPKTVARQLLGKLLVSTTGGKRAAGIIVETEAYLSTGDSACHGHKGETTKNSTMFGPAGFAYVYPIHAKWCFNVVTEASDRGSAVLIRALEPVEGIKQMRIRRGCDPVTMLCSGPAKLCQSLGIDKEANGIDLTRRRKIWLEHVDRPHGSMTGTRKTVRIGVTSASDLQLRYVLANHEFASGPKYLR